VPDERISRIGLNHGGLTTLEKLGNHWTVTALNVSTSPFPNARRKEIEDRP
jgi:hypothetical protein